MREASRYGRSGRIGAMAMIAAVLLLEAVVRAQAPKLNVDIVQGDGAIYRIGRRPAAGIRASVTTETGAPAAGATVRFRVVRLQAGAGGSFDGRSVAVVLAGPTGIAEVDSFRPNAEQGEYLMRITAVLGNRDGFGSLLQKNVFDLRGLRIAVVAGTGAKNRVKAGIATTPIVVVQDEINQSVAGATVRFSLPSSGPGGTFYPWEHVVDTTTDDSGRATPGRLIPNHACGKFRIGVQATIASLSASTEISQQNTACR